MSESKEVIPDAAVEAAAKHILHSTDLVEEQALAVARDALEAACAHLLAVVAAELADAPHANYEEDNYDAGYAHGLAFALNTLGSAK